VSSYQKVGAFRIVNGQKQGGNVASYFCTPDGNVLHVVARPVSAGVLLREARWVVETWKLAALEKKDGGDELKAFVGKAHAERLKREHGLRTPLEHNSPSEQAAGDLVALLEKPEYRNRCPQGKVHLFLSNKPLVPIEQVYRVVFENILGEQVSTNPVAVSGAP
jgi:hypothetical protein